MRDCVDVLRRACAAPATDTPAMRALEQAAAALYHAQKKKRRRARARDAAAHDAVLRATVREARARAGEPSDAAEPAGRWRRARPCYACARPYTAVHGYYDALCQACVGEHLARRAQRADLAGRRALITGARTKAGFALALRMLRDGAHVVALTRFPTDALRRYAREPDAGAWSARLRVVGLDLCDLPRVLAWADAWVAAGEPLDVLVNHAAHTAPYAPAVLDALRRRERPALAPPATAVGLERVSGLQRADDAAVPDALDARAWRQRVEQVDPLHALEALLVNAVAPFVLVSRLLPALLRSPLAPRFVVNVTAIEGRFYQRVKQPYHPHLNMAKAALNMLTRTTAADLAARGVYVNSVDPGWYSDPGDRRAREDARGDAPPLDPLDAAARMYDPIVQGLAGRPVWGCLLKNFVPSPW